MLDCMERFIERAFGALLGWEEVTVHCSVREHTHPKVKFYQKRAHTHTHGACPEHVEEGTTPKWSRFPWLGARGQIKIYEGLTTTHRHCPGHTVRRPRFGLVRAI